MIAARAFIALALIPLAGCSGGESLRLSVDHSEWHASSSLVLDVPSGGFEARFRDGTLDSGRFSAAEMRQIRAALAAARASGFADEDCLRTPPGERTTIVISNGGPQQLELRAGRTQLHAPPDLQCWTPQASALHDLVNALLARRGDAWTMPRAARGPG